MIVDRLHISCAYSINPFAPKPRQPLPLSHARADAAIAKITNKSFF